MREEDYKSLLEQVKLTAMSHSNGRYTGGWLHVRCPLDHSKDRYNHAFLAPEGNCLKCHGKHGTIGLKELCGLWGIPFAGGDIPHYTERSKPEPKAKPPVYYDSAWETNLLSNCEALEYLLVRGVPPEAAQFYKLGWTGNDSNLPAWAHNRITIPWRLEGQVVGVKLKQLGKSGYVSLPNSDFSTFFNYSPGNTRVILETELDACALGWGIRKPLIALATPAGSINAFKLCLLSAVRRLLVNPDDDEAGLKMWQAVKAIRHNALWVKPLFGKKDLGEGLPHLPEWAIKLAV